MILPICSSISSLLAYGNLIPTAFNHLHIVIFVYYIIIKEFSLRFQNIFNYFLKNNIYYCQIYNRLFEIHFHLCCSSYLSLVNYFHFLRTYDLSNIFKNYDFFNLKQIYYYSFFSFLIIQVQYIQVFCYNHIKYYHMYLLSNLYIFIIQCRDFKLIYCFSKVNVKKYNYFLFNFTALDNASKMINTMQYFNHYFYKTAADIKG